jgi:hypothetical protein
MALTNADHTKTEYQLFELDRDTLGARIKVRMSSAQCFFDNEATRCPCI